MRAAIESTDVITSVDGVPCRVWKGRTEAGVPFVALIQRVAVEDGEDDSEFEQLVSRDKPREIVLGEVLLAFSWRAL